MAELRIVVCDRCGAIDRQTTRYYIARGAGADDGSSYFDLCQEHAAPVEQVLATKAAARDCLPGDSAEDDLTRIADGLSGPPATPAAENSTATADAAAEQERPDNVTALGRRKGARPKR